MKQKWFWKWASLIGLLSLVLFVSVPIAFAYEGKTGDEVIIGVNEVIEDDLYVGTNHFVLDGTVKGDLFVGASIIEINGTVEGDLMAGGQTIIINGTVTDDVRLGGSAVKLGEGAQVGNDLMVAAYSLETVSGSSVGNDIFFAGAQARLAGSVAQDAALYTSGLALFGDIGGDVVAEVGAAGDLPAFSPFAYLPDAPALPTVAGGLTVGEDASIGGDFSYTTSTAIAIPVGTVAGRISEQISTVAEGAEVVETAVFSGAWFLNHLRRLVALFLIGLLLIWLMPTWISRVSHAIQEKPVASLGWGLVTLLTVGVAFFLIAVLTIILAIIFGGVTLGNLVGAVITIGLFATIALAVLFGLVVAYMTTTLVSFISGRFILTRLNPDWGNSRVGALALGLLLFVSLTAIPIIGGWVNFVVVLLGLGALWLYGQGILQKRQDKTTLPTAGKPTIQPTGA